jgi:hypothetical protein
MLPTGQKHNKKKKKGKRKSKGKIIQEKKK